MFRRSTAGGAVLAAVAAVLAVSPAQADSTTDRSTLSDALSRDLGLTETTAQPLFAAQERASDLARTLTRQLDGAFAGAWLDGAALQVAVTDPARFPQVRAAGAQPRLAARSAATLAAMTDRLNATAVPDEVASWYVDVTTNEVVVSTTAPAAARRFVAASGVDTAAVRVERVAERPRTLARILGGNAYRMGGGRCSVGFPVQGGFATAGHCGKRGQSTSGPTGRFEGSSFPGDDYAWVATTRADTPVGAVNDYRGGSMAVNGSQQASVGAQVCRSGSTTGWHCGKIHGFNATVNYGNGDVVNGLIKTDVCAEPGDSGGSLIAGGGQAQGVTSGGSGDCKRGGQTYFQPLNEILQAGRLRLLTGGRVG
ncbi:MAG TPA: S1 family peptidase [Pilimelia sp.]|nr:S1 family peptidase [Pilimelia sp.]